LRVDALDDKGTVHNAFFDRDFKEVMYEIQLLSNQVVEQWHHPI
jgi:hypothetical protein